MYPSKKININECNWICNTYVQIHLFLSSVIAKMLLQKEGITYRQVLNKDFEAAIDFYFDVFLKDEPATQSRGGYIMRPCGLVDILYVILQECVCIMAEDTNGTMVGLATNCLFIKGNVPPPKTYMDYCLTFPSIYSYLCVLSDTLWHPNDMFKKYPKYERIFYMHSLAVSPDFRQRQIGQTLVELNLELALEQDCQCVTVMATSEYTRKIMGKKGFETLRIIDQGNFVDCYQNGRFPIFPGVDTSVHVKMIGK